MADRTLPLVYSCSGCSSAAQLVNAVAIKLDRSGAAEEALIDFFVQYLDVFGISKNAIAL